MVVHVSAEHGPIDAADDVLHPPRRLARTEVHLLQDDGVDPLAVAVCGVQLARAVARVDVLVGNDGDEGPAVVQCRTYCAVPVGTGGYVDQVQPHRELVLFQAMLKFLNEFYDFGLPAVADKDLPVVTS